MSTAPAMDIFGMREQILANVELLFPILATNRNGILPPNMGATKFYLVTESHQTKSGFTTYATILFDGPAWQQREGRKMILIIGPDAPDTPQALEGLLDLTQNVLSGLSKVCMCEPQGWKVLEGDGDSKIYKCE